MVVEDATAKGSVIVNGVNLGRGSSIIKGERADQWGTCNGNLIVDVRQPLTHRHLVVIHTHVDGFLHLTGLQDFRINPRIQLGEVAVTAQYRRVIQSVLCVFHRSSLQLNDACVADVPPMPVTFRVSVPLALTAPAASSVIGALLDSLADSEPLDWLLAGT